MNEANLKISFLQTPTFTLNLKYHGGLERAELCILNEFQKKNINVTLFVPSLIGKKNNIKVIRDLGYRNRFFKWYYYFIFIIKTFNSHIRHGHFTPLLALLAPKNSVIHFHGDVIFDLPLFRYQWAKKRYMKAHYILNSKWLLEKFNTTYPKIPRSNTHLIYYGTDIADTITYLPKRDYYQKVNICWYGVWEKAKGIFDLLDIAKKLESERNDFLIHIGGSASFEGDTKDSSEIESEVREFAQSLSCIEIVGPISHDELPTFLSKQHIGIFNPIHNEPFGLVGIEMMAAGLPVLSYDIGGPKEYVISDKNGYLVPFHNTAMMIAKLHYLLDNRDKIAELGKYAFHYTHEKFSWDSHINQLLNLYNNSIIS